MQEILLSFKFPTWERITSVSSIFKKKVTHLFEDFFLSSDSGRVSHINLHFAQLFIISSDKKSLRWELKVKILPFTREGRPALCQAGEPHHTPHQLLAASCFSATVTSNTFYLAVQRNLNGLTAQGMHHVPSQHLKRVGSFITRKTCRNI